jgi:hypothetical protein
MDELIRRVTHDAIEMSDANQSSIDDEEDSPENAGAEEDGHVALGGQDPAKQVAQKSPMLLANIINSSSLCRESSSH